MSCSLNEAEYKSLADTVAKVTWLETLLCELRIPVTVALVLWCANFGATYLFANPIFHARTKHFEVATKRLSVHLISTFDQIVDIFTRPLSSQRSEGLRPNLQVLTRP